MMGEVNRGAHMVGLVLWIRYDNEEQTIASSLQYSPPSPSPPSAAAAATPAAVSPVMSGP